MYANNELMFPHSLLPSLRSLRGPQWQTLVERVLTLEEVHEETLALMLTLIRLNGCLACETDSFRAMRGCEACAVQTLRRYKGSDDDLLAQFQTALTDVRTFAQTHKQAALMQQIVSQPAVSQPANQPVIE
jgi:hypothetical protein